ncbi:Cilia- and flagella-associated protein 221 [Hondaea fermentalgiana]|uniref:Cilia-and flagella-associated protein 221 n=1 Tax=Hondaea fermentalgiana TaxID=2315210 RepID=A0A2R5GIW7_9STRA|nr:Cilia- and flagella-associated protein 221 [Hondaea fermentalgiana]|eukprot:GBG27814.1 Cilia- and flagella-associated protein 221 [Hondaea fermentalgiana]
MQDDREETAPRKQEDQGFSKPSWKGPDDFVRIVKLDAQRKSNKNAPGLGNDDAADERSEIVFRTPDDGAPPADFTVTPSVVHFGGYKVGDEHVVKVRVTNNTNEAIRVRIRSTETEPFQTSHKPRAKLRPGLSEVVRICFRPQEWKYYRDTIVVMSSTAQVEIPIHAYPVVNRVDVPRMLDFGACELMQTHRRHLQLSCKVPMDFDFEVLELASSSEFRISPLSGRIPAGGSTRLMVEYTPHHLKVSSYSFRLNINQFGFEPIVCTVTGSSRPGLVRSAELERDQKHFHEELDARYRTQASPQLINSLKQARFDIYGDAAPGLQKRSAHHDPGGDALRRTKTEFRESSNQDEARAENSPREGRRLDLAVPAAAGDADTDMVVIEGIRFPKRLEGVQATNFCLTQNQDKLKPKDLKLAINKQRRARAQEKRAKELAQQKFGGAGRMDPVERILNQDMRASDTSVTTQVKEMVFLQHVSEIEDEERSREFASQAVCIGDVRLEASETAAIQDARARVVVETALSQREEERHAFGTRCLGPTSIPPTRVSALVQAQQPMETQKDAQSEPAFEAPSFDPFVNDEWRKRKAVIVRLMNVVGKILVRKRAERRLTAIWKRLGSARTRKAVRALVEEDHIRAKLAVTPASKGVSREGHRDGEKEPSWKKHRREIMKKPANQLKPLGTEARLARLSDSQAILPPAEASKAEDAPMHVAPGELAQAALQEKMPGAMTDPVVPRAKILNAALKKRSQLHLVSFPQFNDSTVFDAKPVPTAPVQGFQDLGLFKLRAPDEYKLCGYEKFAYPHLTQYLPRCDDMELRSGAPEESSWDVREKVLPEEALAIEMPREWSKSRSTPGLEFLLPARRRRVFESTDIISEAELEFQLQPRPIKLKDSQTRGEKEAWVVGVSGARALSSEPTISDRFRPLRTPLRIEKTSLWCIDSEVASLLEGPREEDELSDDEDEDDEELKAREAHSKEEEEELKEGMSNAELVSKMSAISMGLKRGASEDVPQFENVEKAFFGSIAQNENTSPQSSARDNDEGLAEDGDSQPKLPVSDVNYHKELLEVEIDASRREKYARLESHLARCQEAIGDPLLKFRVRDLR